MPYAHIGKEDRLRLKTVSYYIKSNKVIPDLNQCKRILNMIRIKNLTVFYSELPSVVVL